MGIFNNHHIQYLPNEIYCKIFHFVFINLKHVVDINKNDINKINKQRLKLLCVNKLFYDIIICYFDDILYFPINLDINYVTKYKCLKIIAPFDTQMRSADDEELKHLPNITVLNLFFNKNMRSAETRD